jgi:hypothetical protein
MLKNKHIYKDKESLNKNAKTPRVTIFLNDLEHIFSMTAMRKFVIKITSGQKYDLTKEKAFEPYRKYM